MDWDNFDDKLKKGIDRNFVSCTEEYELDYLKSNVKKAAPHLLDAEIEAAIRACCATLKPPRSRDAFIACLKRRLRGF
jgi:hypothetical protein